MNYITDSNGKVISRSQNLRGLMEFLRRKNARIFGAPCVVTCEIVTGRSKGYLTIVWNSGESFRADFASFSVLVEFIRKRRNRAFVYAKEIWIDGVDMRKSDSVFWS